jgi:hypothetical protein
LLEALTSNRFNCRFDDVERLLLALGCSRRKTSGSHVIFALESRIISVPKRTPLKQVYVDHLLELVKPLL